MTVLNRCSSKRSERFTPLGFRLVSSIGIHRVAREGADAGRFLSSRPCSCAVKPEWTKPGLFVMVCFP